MNAMSKTAKRIINALAFANVGNQNEFHTLLRRIDEPDTSVCEPAQSRAMAQASGNAPVIGHIQGAV
jgi:hypothetical protein